MQDLEGRVAVVTGAASGIGLAMAKTWAAEGMKLVMADIEQERLDAAADEVRQAGAEVMPVVCDVRKAESVEALAASTYERFGAAHVVCNNAGVEVLGQVWEHTLDDWEWVMGVNLWGVIHGVHSFLPRMMEQSEGHIVNTASMAALATSPFMAIYDVTKFGVMALTEATYRDLQVAGSPLGVTVVCPGLINTDIIRSKRNRPAGHSDEGTFGEGAQKFRAGLGSGLESGYPPEEVARQVLGAVKANQFYCIPAQPDVFEGAKRRFDDILNGRNPSPR